MNTDLHQYAKETYGLYSRFDPVKEMQPEVQPPPLNPSSSALSKGVIPFPLTLLLYKVNLIWISDAICSL